MKFKHLCWFTVALFTLVCFGAIGVYVIDPSGHWHTMVRYWRGDRPVVFYGRVVDQQGTPIADAIVSISYEYFDLTSSFGKSGYLKKGHLERTTDSTGTFSVRDVKANALFIDAISHPLFVSIPEKNWTYEAYWKELSFTYARDGTNPSYVPDQKNPAVFPLLRLGEVRTMAPHKGGVERVFK